MATGLPCAAYPGGAIGHDHKMKTWHATVEDMITRSHDAVQVRIEEHHDKHRNPDGWHPDGSDPAPERIGYVKIHATMTRTKRQDGMAQIAATAKRPRDSQPT